MKKNILTVLLLPLVLLTSCSGTNKTSFSRFREEAETVIASYEEPYSIRITGTLTKGMIKYKVFMFNYASENDVENENQSMIVSVVKSTYLQNYIQFSNEYADYYCGNGFKYTQKNHGTIIWNKYGDIKRIDWSTETYKCNIFVDNIYGSNPSKK